MKVVVWNMNHRTRAWDALAKLTPDVALLNEASAPRAEVPHVLGGRETKGRDLYARRWAAAIRSEFQLTPITDAKAIRRGKYVDLPFENSRPGSWEAAVLARAGEEITLVSLYGLLDEKSDASVHRSLSELTPLFEDPRYRTRLLLGGDLNVLANPRPSDPFRERYLSVLTRIRAFGLVDCLEGGLIHKPRPKGPEGCPCQLIDCTHWWTHRHGKNNVPYQDDYLFASRAMADRLETCEALSPLDWTDYSDHSPIIANFTD